MRILWLNPIGTDIFDTELQNTLEAGKRPETQVAIVSLPPDRPKHVDYHAYEALVIADVVRHTQQAAYEYDAVVIGCFYDLGLREAREVSEHTIVTAPCQSATAIASHLGNTFSVLVGQRKNTPKMSENVRLYGHGHRMVSMRPLELGVHEYQVDHERTCSILLTEGRKAVEEDGAEVIILGCAANFGFYRQMQDDLSVPVIDAVLAPLKYAELLAENGSTLRLVPQPDAGQRSAS
jgi:allantoin racemase